MLDSRDRADLLNVLKSHLSCQDEDALVDDLNSYDSMEGVDCYSGDGGVFIRVYEHSASINQVLQDWAPTLVGSRGVLRGENWFAVGDKTALKAVTPPESFPVVARTVGHPLPLTPTESDESTCVQFMAVWTMKFIENPEQYRADIEGFEKQLPRADREIRSLANAQLVAKILSIKDLDRRHAALSSAGPGMKRFCSHSVAQQSLEDVQ